jgi:hypothetical protein
MPTYPNSLARGPSCDAWTDRIDYSRDLMAGHPRILNSREESFFGKRIAVTDTACLNLDANLSGSGLRNLAFNDFKRPIRARDLDSTHLWHSHSIMKRMTGVTL